MTFDMGGTSTDVSLCPGVALQTREFTIAGVPVALPVLDIHTVGAGGGSIARLDAGGALRVGPESAGARPGPACYGRGGVAATVTDANVWYWADWCRTRTCSSTRRRPRQRSAVWRIAWRAAWRRLRKA
jgi:N-methylhydantoinase A/oxoprolinase/acetone carboxylase beta subunit